LKRPLPSETAIHGAYRRAKEDIGRPTVGSGNYWSVAWLDGMDHGQEGMVIWIMVVMKGARDEMIATEELTQEEINKKPKTPRRCAYQGPGSP
jgi:hypothetical protein